MGDEPEKERIEVGAVKRKDLQLWRAREALRQAEQRLTFQAASLATLEARAQSVIGWAVAAGTALTSAMLIGMPSPILAVAATFALISVLTSAWMGLKVLRPGKWAQFGDPAAMVNSEALNEMVELEEIALGLGEGIERNEKRLAAAGVSLEWAFRFLAFTPVAGLAGAALGFGANWALATFGGAS